MSSLMLLGCVILDTHYEHAVGAKRKVHIAMAFGQPNTAKSTALECALSVLGGGEMPLGGNNMYLTCFYQYMLWFKFMLGLMLF